MHHDALQCMVMYCGASSRMDRGVFWIILVHGSASWCIVVHCGTSMGVHGGAKWFIRFHHVALWCIVVHSFKAASGVGLRCRVRV